MLDNYTFPKTALIGFDQMVEDMLKLANLTTNTYPPHNIVKASDSRYTIELAIAGFSIEDLTIELSDKVITVSGDRKQRRASSEYLHQGISTRKFTKQFTISDNTTIENAKMEDGLLVINLLVNIPTKAQVKRIEITNAKSN